MLKKLITARRSPRPGFSRYCRDWLERQRGRVRDSTYVKYETVLRRHIIPALGELPAREVDFETVERFKKGLLESGLAVKTVRDILTVLRSVLKYASARYPELARVNVSCPKPERAEARVLSEEELARFMVYLRENMDGCRLGVLLALSTGMRIGEVCALRWGGVSVSERTVRVEAAMQRLRDVDAGGTRIYIGAPKTGRSVRTIPLTESMAELCGRFDPRRPEPFVLTGTERYMEPRQLQRRLAKYTADCGLEGVHFHTLRHTFATRCVEVGFELKSLSEILGHASTAITMERYVHSSMALKRANMEKLSAVGL